MENGETLGNYIQNAFPEKHPCLENPDLPISFQWFLKSIIILESTEENLKISVNYLANQYPEFIDLVIKYLIDGKSSNVLANGYSQPSSNGWNSHTLNSTRSFPVNEIKKPNWHRVYAIIGKENFTHLLLCTRGFLMLGSNTFLQLFGSPSLFKTNHKSSTFEISKLKSLYHQKAVQGISKVFFEDNFHDLLSLNANPEFPKLLSAWKNNDKNCKYSFIFKSIVKQNIPHKEVLKNATKIGFVVKFVLTICGKLFPMQTWGNEKNKKLFLKLILTYLRSPANLRICLQSSLIDFDHEQITWSINVETTLLVMLWILKNVVSRIVSSYWYTTNLTASGENVYYFEHNIWNKLTKSWFEEYLNKYLTIADCSESLDEVINNYNYGYLRLIPKVNSFRLILVPAKVLYSMRKEPVCNESKFGYIAAKESIDFIRLLLSKMCSDFGAFPYNSTVNEVVNDINDYKLSVCSRIGCQKPKYYILKFDMKESYDRLNSTLLLEIIDRLFANVEDDFIFSLRNFSTSPDYDLRLRKLHLEIHDQNYIANIHGMDFGTRCVLIDRAKTLKFTKEQVLAICREHILNTSAILSGFPNILKRKVGVFQGCPLLSTFCNILYTLMMNEQFANLVNSESRCFRVADDFLLITSDLRVYTNIRELTKGTKLHKYGAFVNKAKTFLSVESSAKVFSFLGLRIDVGTLDIYKDFKESSVPHVCSDEYLCSYLVKACIKGIERSFIDLKFSSFKCVTDNITAAFKSTLQLFLNYLSSRKANPMNLENLGIFLSKLIDGLQEKFCSVNAASELFKNIRYCLILTTEHVFQNHHLSNEVKDWLKKFAD